MNVQKGDLIEQGTAQQGDKDEINWNAAGKGPHWCPGRWSAAIINIAEGGEADDDEWTRPTTKSKIPTWDYPTVTVNRNFNSQVTWTACTHVRDNVEGKKKNPV